MELFQCLIGKTIISASGCKTDGTATLKRPSKVKHYRSLATMHAYMRVYYYVTHHLPLLDAARPA